MKKTYFIKNSPYLTAILNFENSPNHLPNCTEGKESEKITGLESDRQTILTPPNIIVLQHSKWGLTYLYLKLKKIKLFYQNVAIPVDLKLSLFH